MDFRSPYPSYLLTQDGQLDCEVDLHYLPRVPGLILTLRCEVDLHYLPRNHRL